MTSWNLLLAELEFLVSLRIILQSIVVEASRDHEAKSRLSHLNCDKILIKSKAGAREIFLFYRAHSSLHSLSEVVARTSIYLSVSYKKRRRTKSRATFDRIQSQMIRIASFKRAALPIKMRINKNIFSLIIGNFGSARWIGWKTKKTLTWTLNYTRVKN